MGGWGRGMGRWGWCAVGRPSTGSGLAVVEGWRAGGCAGVAAVGIEGVMPDLIRHPFLAPGRKVDPGSGPG